MIYLWIGNLIALYCNIVVCCLAIKCCLFLVKNELFIISDGSQDEDQVISLLH